MIEPDPRELDARRFPRRRPVPTRWSDNDMFGHLNNAVYLELFDSVLNAWMQARPGSTRTSRPPSAWSPRRAAATTARFLPGHRRRRGPRQPVGPHQRAVRVRRLPARRRADRRPRAVGPGLRRPRDPTPGAHAGCRAHPPRGCRGRARRERALSAAGSGIPWPTCSCARGAALARRPTARGPGSSRGVTACRRGRGHRPGPGVGPRPGHRRRPRRLAPRRLRCRPRPSGHDPPRGRGRLGRRAGCRAPRRGDRHPRAVAARTPRPARTTRGCSTPCRSAATCACSASRATTRPC